MTTKLIKKDGTYDGRAIEGRQSKGKSLHPKKTDNQFQKATKTHNKSGKKV